jgi:DNA-binding MarR family transcriptional regulator
LSILGLVRRKRDPSDGRNVLVQRTIRGSVYLTDLADQIARAAAGGAPATVPAHAA